MKTNFATEQVQLYSTQNRRPHAKERKGSCKATGLCEREGERGEKGREGWNGRKRGKKMREREGRKGREKTEGETG